MHRSRGTGLEALPPSPTPTPVPTPTPTPVAQGCGLPSGGGSGAGCPYQGTAFGGDVDLAIDRILAQAHDRALAELLVDRRERQLDGLVTGLIAGRDRGDRGCGL